MSTEQHGPIANPVVPIVFEVPTTQAGVTSYEGSSGGSSCLVGQGWAGGGGASTGISSFGGNAGLGNAHDITYSTTTTGVVKLIEQPWVKEEQRRLKQALSEKMDGIGVVPEAVGLLRQILECVDEYTKNICSELERRLSGR